MYGSDRLRFREREPECNQSRPDSLNGAKNTNAADNTADDASEALWAEFDALSLEGALV